MLRIISRAAALASLVAASLAGTSAQAQVIDLRFASIASGRPGQTIHHQRTNPHQQRVTPTRFQTANLRSRTTFPTSAHDVGAVPGQPGTFPVAQHQHLGGFPVGAGPIPEIGPGFPSTGFGQACVPGASPVIEAVDVLIGEVGAFLQVFGPTRHCVPEGNRIYRDALALYESAVAFRQAALSGASPHVLQRLYASMDTSCCRLVSRVNRISRGRTGPNIEQVRRIGALCNQIRVWI